MTKRVIRVLYTYVSRLAASIPVLLAETSFSAASNANASVLLARR